MRLKDLTHTSIEAALSETKLAFVDLCEDTTGQAHVSAKLKSWADAYFPYVRLMLAELGKNIETLEADPTDSLKAFELGRVYGHIQAVTGYACSPIPSLVLRAKDRREIARSQWESNKRDRLLESAVLEAESLWKGGDTRKHDAMARFLRANPKYKELTKSVLLEKLRPVARKHDRLLGVKRSG